MSSIAEPHRYKRSHRYSRRNYPGPVGSGPGGRDMDGGRGNDRGEEVRLSESLRCTLERQGVFESEEGSRRRKMVLERLERLLQRWADSLASGRDEEEGAANAALCTFGSFRLGVHKPGSDIDALALCPPHCSRAEFFSSLLVMLKADPSVEDMHPVPNAYTPVLKFAFDGVPIDLVFAHLADKASLLRRRKSASSSRTLSEREEFRIEDAHLIGLDEVSVRSINGVRVAQLLLKLVPDAQNFRLTLLAIKQWATICGLYSNVLGFLGGVNWAILVASICIQHPQLLPSSLLYHFFDTFSSWPWPKPVRLLHSTSPPNVPNLTQWNPNLNPRDRSHLMPIITPAYPTMNSSYNVGRPQLRRLNHELRRAYQTLIRVRRGDASFFDLYRGNDFFQNHLHYLQVNIIARNAKDFRAWFGLCESKLRILIVCLDSPELGIEAYPFAKFFHRKVDQPSKMHISSFFIALRFAHGVENVDLKSCTSEFLYKVNAWDQRQFGMDLTIEHKLQNVLPEFVFENEGKKEAASDKRQSPSATDPSPKKRARQKSPPLRPSSPPLRDQSDNKVS